ncbi:MAG: ATP phosphoribosyltransferase regulatory subunit [Bariatricus sp.]|nr:ATP phosphoribosyltransferase regulatory subunit [Bariatricus sp.]
MKQLLHTPEGVRDIYKDECARKLALTNRLHKVLHLYGYHDIETPTFEFFDVFRKEIGTIPSKELYKFFDREGNTLVLRPDMTPQIARVAATLLGENEFPARLCYVGSTFINHSSYQGRLRESTQLGAEFLGLDHIDADAEMLALVVDCLKKAGLEEFQINVGNVDFFQSLMDDAKVDEETEARLRELIANRNFYGVDELLAEADVKKGTRGAFAALSDLVGGKEVLDAAKHIAPNAKAIKAIKRLEAIYDVLKAYNVADYVSFDLSMCGTYGYYTGIIFRGYTFGTGDAIVKGGRYDQLVEKFGRRMPSIGFAIVIDELMNALQRQKIQIPHGQKNTLVVYDEGRQKDAVLLAREFRNKDKNTELLMKEEEKPVEFYLEYGKRNLAGGMLYLQNTNQIRMFNLETGEQKIIKSRD